MDNERINNKEEKRNKKEIFSQDNVNAAYDLYHQEKIDRNEYFMVVYDEYKKCAALSIKQTYKMSGADQEDFLQEAAIVILNNLEKYDPKKSSIVTFFAKYLEEAYGNCAEKYSDPVKKLTKHQRRKYNEMIRGIRNYGFQDLESIGYDEVKISQLSDVPLATVQGILTKLNTTISSFEELPEMQSELSSDPADLMVANESSKFLAEIYSTLTPFEKYLASVTFLADKRKSDLAITKELNRGLISNFEDETLPEVATQKFVSASINKVLTKIRRHPLTTRWTTDSRDLKEECYVQAQVSEIENAWEAGFLD